MKTIKASSLEDVPIDFTGIAEYPNRTKKWFKEGKLHREDGPAHEYSDGSGEWWVNGFYYHPISLKNYVVFDYWQGEYGIMWYRLLGKDKIFEYPDIPGLIIE